MAGNAVIGALRVVLGADSAALDKGLKDSQGSLASFGSAVAAAGAAAAAAFVAAGVGVAAAVHGIIDQADKIGKMAQKVGIPVEELSALKYAAELSDISLESLGKSLGKLSKAMLEAATKPTGEAANAFKALGVSVIDSNGKLKSAGDVTADIAEKFAGLKDGAGKTAVAMALFGKAGAEMIPLLNGGRTGLEELTKEAQEFGIVISTQTAKSAEAFNDNLKRLTKTKEGLFLQLTSQLLPSLLKFSEIMVQNSKDGLLAKAGAEVLGSSLLNLTQVTLTAITGWQRLGAEWKALKEFMTTPLSAASWKKFNEAGLETQRIFATLNATFEDDPIGTVDAALAALGKTTGTSSKALKDFNYQAMAGKTALDAFLDSQTKSQAAQVAELATVGLAAGAKERLRVVLQGLAVAQANSIILTDAQRLALSTAAFNAEQLALKIQGQQLVMANSAPAVQYATDLANTNIAMMAVNATAEQLARAQEQVGQKFGMTATQIGSSVADTAGSLAQLSATFSKENKAMGIASKAFGIAQAIINTQIAITKALATLPPPASYFAVAAAVAQGAASVATISAQKFAMGGSFKVPGGIGGGDKVFAPMMLEPGETVDVSSNRAGGYQGGRGSGSMNVTLVGKSFSLDSVKDLFAKINEGLGDGHRINVATA